MYKVQDAILKKIQLIGHCSLILFTAFCCASLISILAIRPALAASYNVNQQTQHVVCCEDGGGVESGGGVPSSAGEDEGSSTSSGSHSSDSGDEGSNGGGRSYIPFFSSSQGGSGSGTFDPGVFVAIVILLGSMLLINWLAKKSRR